MPSSLSWIEFSEADRRRTQDVLDLLNESETRDELGLGVVRDALGDILFPGTSTIQTRARYFFFIPWVYQRLASRGVSEREVIAKARRAELDLIAPLEAAQDHEGVIGGTAGETLQRLPSAVYWAGLGVWGLRKLPVSLSHYHRQFRRFHEAPDRSETNDDARQALVTLWDRQLPPAPASFPGQVSLELTRKESEYLRDRIQALGPSLLAHLVRGGQRLPNSSFPWDLPGLAESQQPFGRPLEHARCFSEVMHGAALLYNLMLAEQSGDQGYVDSYHQALADWRARLAARRAAHAAWEPKDLWSLLEGTEVRPSQSTIHFVTRWRELALSSSPQQLTADPGARELIRAREQRIKHSRARLGNQAALANWGGASGAGSLNYRWHRVFTIVNDILAGLGRN